MLKFSYVGWNLLYPSKKRWYTKVERLSIPNLASVKRSGKYLSSKTNFDAFLHTSCLNFRLKLWKVTKFEKKNQIWSVLVQFRSKKLFVETTIHKILETNSSFCLKECITGKIPFPFFSSFLLILMKFSFCKEEWAWDNNSIRFSDFSDIS